jgi:hypothetical protein
MISRKEIVEQQLGVKVPEQYAAFLEKYGIYNAPGVEVYGISDNLLGYHGMPCVIGATELSRKHDDLPHRFLVVHHTDIEDETICLDTESEEVYSISYVFGTHKIAESFDEWFQRDIIDFHKSPRPEKYVGQKIVNLEEMDWIEKLEYFKSTKPKDK